MNPDKEFKALLRKTKILKNPKHRLSTFGETKIPYFFLSEIIGFKDRSRLREGIVIAEKPKIITPEVYKKRFEGFGEDAEEFGRWLGNTYGDIFRGLHYQFKNETKTTHVEYSSLKNLTEQITSRLTPNQLDASAIIKGPEAAWQVSMMKFIVDECMASFHTNIRDLDQHGFFDDPKTISSDREKEIDKLFARAKSDRTFLEILAKKLRQYGLFEKYEDRFFKLYK